MIRDLTITTLEQLVRTYGYWALLAGTFFEGETILIIGGFLARLGYLELPVVMLVAFIGSFSGDQFYFHVGRLRGIELLARYPNWQKRVHEVHQRLERYHDLIMLGFRFVYGMRIMTPFVLALNKKVKTSRFILLNAIGAAMWSVTVAGGGYLFGSAVEIVFRDIKHYQLGLILVISVSGVILWLVHKYRERRKS
jgi:membrane protein DedA with SNARE-associated domain